MNLLFKTPVPEIQRWGFLFFLPFIWLSPSAHAQMHDHFRNYAELSRSLKKGSDYRIELKSRPSPIAIFAIHGGVIEPGTVELARAIAGDDFSLYTFEGLKRGHGEAAHLTATHFDEPQALTLAEKSELCLSTHGFASSEKKLQVCLGGGNEKLKTKIMASDFENVEWTECPRLPGKSPKNIVNRCHEPGIQMEMSPELRRKILRDSAFKIRFANWIRKQLSRE